MVDGELGGGDLVLDNAQLIAAHGPWGKDFEEPRFHGEFEVVAQRVVGERHLKLVLRRDSRVADAIAFNREPIAAKQVRAVYRLAVNDYGDADTLQLEIDGLGGKDMSALRGLGPLAAFGLFLAWTCGEVQASTATIEEIVVVAKTGSRIGRQADFASPLAEYDGETLDRYAAKDIRDLVGLLPTDNGAENNSDNLTQNFTVGTANVNLRGLGVASTLVLLNGKRQVSSAVQTDDGSSFVDLAGLVPLLAVERVEILKDGASAVYGSDAVAGVVNFITRRDLDGFDLRGEYRTRVGNGSQADVNLDVAFGGPVGDAGTVLLAASYLDRSSLVLGEVDWLRPATSGFGNPGSFTLPSSGATVADPGCTANGGLLQNLTDGNTICRFDFGPQITAVPVEDRLQGYGATRLGLGPGGTTLGRTRIRTQRRQPRSVAKLPGAQHARGAGPAPWQRVRRRRLLSRPSVRRGPALRRSTTTSITPCARLSARKGIGRTVAAGACRTCTAQTTPSSIRATSWQRTSRRLSSVSAARIATPARRRRCGPCRAWDRAGTSTRSVRRSPPDRGMRPTTIPNYASSSLATTSAMPSPRWGCSTPTSRAISVASAAAQPGSPSVSSGVIRRSPTSTTRSPATTASPS